MSVNEYITKFTQLSRYDPHDVDTDEKKQECILNGLNDGLAYTLEARDFENFQGMVNKALVFIWTSSSWCSLMIYWSTPVVKKSMKDIFV
jgi:hypothetical protein